MSSCELGESLESAAIRARLIGYYVSGPPNVFMYVSARVVMVVILPLIMTILGLVWASQRPACTYRSGRRSYARMAAGWLAAAPVGLLMVFR